LQDHHQISGVTRKRGRPLGARDKSPRRPRFGQLSKPNRHQPRKRQQAAEPVLPVADVAVERPQPPEWQQPVPAQPQYGWKKRRWAQLVGVGVSTVDDLIRCREIEHIKLGAQLVLVVTHPQDWIRKKLEQQAALPPGETLPKIPRRRRRPQLVQA
jgi:hypothetical protein